MALIRNNLLVTDEFVEDLRILREELEAVNREFITTVNIDVQQIKEQLMEDAKRELQGKSSYGIGIR